MRLFNAPTFCQRIDADETLTSRRAHSKIWRTPTRKNFSTNTTLVDTDNTSQRAETIDQNNTHRDTF